MTCHSEHKRHKLCDGQLMVVRMAIDLMLVPSRVRIMQAETLPDQVLFLLRIVSGDIAAAQEVAELVGKPVEGVQAAAAFYIEQILFARDSDSYRVLGAQQDATSVELRRNLALLFKWLHSEKGLGVERSVFMVRLMNAWNNVKTPERRAAYDMELKARSVMRQKCFKDKSDSLSISFIQQRGMRPAHTVKFHKKAAKAPLATSQKAKPPSLLRRFILFLSYQRSSRSL